MGKLKALLRRWPWAYAKLQRGWYKLLYLGETRIIGSKVHEWIWRRQDDESPEVLSKTLTRPDRCFLLDAIEKRVPFKSVLEVGCGSAPNLLLLARRFPDVAFHGIDINPRFVERGREWLAREGVTNVTLAVGRADDLAGFENRSIDVTFTHAILMYVGPDKIGQNLEEMRRVTRQALILDEWCLDDTPSPNRSLWYNLHWVHNYGSLLEEHVPGCNVRITKLPADLWGDVKGWGEYGSLVEVDL